MQTFQSAKRESSSVLWRHPDVLHADVTNLKVRMTNLEAEAGHVRIGLAEVNGRLDRMDAAFNRIEWRLEFIKAP